MNERRSIRVWSVIGLTVFALDMLRAQSLDGAALITRVVESFDRVGEKWNAGETNLPLLSIQWFPDSWAVRQTTVDLSGAVRNGSLSPMGAKGWGPCGLTTNDLKALRQMIHSLPAPTTNPVPVARLILIHGLRSNSWFTAVYDRADIPSEVEALCSKVCEAPTWIVPSLKHVDTNAFVPGRDGWMHRFETAAEAPVALSGTAEGIQVWNLETWSGVQAVPVICAWPSVALSPDGKLMFLGSAFGVNALTLPEMTNRWHHPVSGGAPDRQWCQHLAVIDGGRSLAVGLSDRIEKWSLQTGKFESVLSTLTVPFDRKMKSSRDGSVLVADIGENRAFVWRHPWTNAPQQLVASGLLEISPDGKLAAFSGAKWLGHRLSIFDLARGTQIDMPFRGLYKGEAQHAAWSPDGRFFVATAPGMWPCVYDTTTWKPVLLWQVPGEGQYWSGGSDTFIAFASDGTLLARSDDRVLRALKLPVAPSLLKGDLPTSR